ncbi:uncharacterized protein LOC134842140 [Symsagittifera roscoffensis]|uniref:uncharacterized protein LOC134842140 n=1 Tax=Symsagittifera roscoffensis TaxID=84072 RepID=UPI00307C422D
MKQQHVDLLNEFSSKHGGWNSKMTKISPGNILLVCPPEMFDALGRCLLSEKSGWKSSARGDNSGTEQFYAFEPYTPFSKYQTLKKQAGDSCTKIMTLEKGKCELTIANGLLPPGMNEIEGSKFTWDDANVVLNILWTSRKPAGAFSSLKNMMGGGSSSSSSGSKSSSNSNPSDPFTQDEVFKWIHRYVNVDNCECRVDRCTKDQCNHRKTQPRVESLLKTLLELIKSDKVFSTAKPCPCCKCVDKANFTLRLHSLKAEDMFALLNKLALDSIVLQQMVNFRNETRLHEQQISSTGNRLMNKWKGMKSAVSEQANSVTGQGQEEEEGFKDYVPSMPSKAGLIKSMFLG